VADLCHHYAQLWNNGKKDRERNKGDIPALTTTQKVKGAFSKVFSRKKSREEPVTQEEREKEVKKEEDAEFLNSLDRIMQQTMSRSHSNKLKKAIHHNLLNRMAESKFSLFYWVRGERTQGCEAIEVKGQINREIKDEVSRPQSGLELRIRTRELFQSRVNGTQKEHDIAKESISLRLLRENAIPKEREPCRRRLNQEEENF